jgi:hypothetical protein
MINFALKDATDILPWGTEPDTNIHWFGLTDGYYWLSVGDKTLFECTKEVRNMGASQYVDYNIVRFLEDFTELFSAIAESLPEDFYRLARSRDSLNECIVNLHAWLDQLPADEDANLDPFYDKYDEVLGWIHSRRLTSRHLKYGPQINFFRCNDKISIVWDSDYTDENGIAVWTAANGQVEMPYQLFVDEVKGWGERFFDSMQSQISKAIQKDWGTTKIDINRINEEQAERKKKFVTGTNQFLTTSQRNTDWSRVRQRIGEMKA